VYCGMFTDIIEGRLQAKRSTGRRKTTLQYADDLMESGSLLRNEMVSEVQDTLGKGS